MSFPVMFSIGSLVFPAHLFFELLAFVVGYSYYKYIKNKKLDPLLPEAEGLIVAAMAVGAFIGSRFVAALEHPTIFLHTQTWLYYVGGQTIAGGIVGAIFGVEVAKYFFKIKRKTGDLFVYPLILGIIIGRIGCFLQGVSDGTAGLPSSLPWALVQGDGIARHPTALYEIIFIIICWIILRLVEQKNILKEGDLFRSFVFLYGAWRFFVEFIKPRDVLYLNLSSIQILGLCLVIYYFIYFIRHYKKHDYPRAS